MHCTIFLWKTIFFKLANLPSNCFRERVSEFNLSKISQSNQCLLVTVLVDEEYLPSEKVFINCHQFQLFLFIFYLLHSYTAINHYSMYNIQTPIQEEHVGCSTSIEAQSKLPETDVESHPFDPSSDDKVIKN